MNLLDFHGYTTSTTLFNYQRWSEHHHRRHRREEKAELDLAEILREKIAFAFNL